jgi:putative transposase
VERLERLLGSGQAGDRVLYIFIILGLERRRLIFANVTTNPTAQWLAQQVVVVNAFPWDTAPRFLIRDRDTAYGSPSRPE